MKEINSNDLLICPCTIAQCDTSGQVPWQQVLDGGRLSLSHPHIHCTDTQAGTCAAFDTFLFFGVKSSAKLDCYKHVAG